MFGCLRCPALNNGLPTPNLSVGARARILMYDYRVVCARACVCVCVRTCPCACACAHGYSMGFRSNERHIIRGHRPSAAQLCVRARGSARAFTCRLACPMVGAYLHPAAASHLDAGALHCSTLRYTARLYTTPHTHCSTLDYTYVHYTTLHYTTLHNTRHMHTHAHTPARTNARTHEHTRRGRSASHRLPPSLPAASPRRTRTAASAGCCCTTTLAAARSHRCIQAS